MGLERERTNSGIQGLREDQEPESENEAKLQAGVSTHKFDALIRLGGTIIRTGGVVWVAYLFFDAAKAFAGRETLLLTLMEGSFKVAVNQWFAYALAAVTGTGCAIQTYRLRNRIKQNAAYTAKLEHLIDPARSSSGLLETGERKKDGSNG